MSEQLNDKLVEFMDLALNGIEASTDFMSAELPLYIEQLLTWFLILSSIKFIGSFLLVFATYKTVKFISKKLPPRPTNRKESNWLWEGYSDGDTMITGVGVLAFISFGVALFVTVGLLVQLFNLEWLQILIAPKVWLVEYTAKLVG